MMRRTRWFNVSFILLVGLALLAGWINVLNAPMTAHAREITTAAIQGPVQNNITNPTNITSDSPDVPQLAEACGGGQQLPAWAICLYGTVSLIDQFSQTTALNGVPITISRGNHSVTGVTFVHPGQVTPTYGIDISALHPEFLKPVLLTANISGTHMQEQVIIFPHFQTLSQRYDLLLSTAQPLSTNLIWGHVVDFAAGGAVTNAHIIASHADLSVTVMTRPYLSAAPPIYFLNTSHLFTIGAESGSVITLTATYGNDIDQKIIVVPEELTQIDFVTGWKCDDFDPLPQEGGADGLPQEGGADGLPDVTCFWGFVSVYDKLPAGVSVQITLSNTTYAGQTKYYPGESVPRYGIGVWGNQIAGIEQLTATAIYSGLTNVRQVAVTIDQAHSQRLNIPIRSGAAYPMTLAANSIRDQVWNGNDLWVATKTGVTRWTPENNNYERFARFEDAPWQINDFVLLESGSVWAATSAGVKYLIPGLTPRWQTFDTENSELASNSVNVLAVTPDDSLWFGTAHGLSHFIPGNEPVWVNYTIDNSPLPHNRINAIVAHPDGTLWFGTDDGVITYTAGAPYEWGESINSANSGLVDDHIQTIAVGTDGSLWFGTNQAGISRLILGTPNEWRTYSHDNGDLVHNHIRVISAGPGNMTWVGTPDGVSLYLGDDANEWIPFSTDNGLTSNNISSISVHNNTVWVGSFDDMVMSYYVADPIPEWGSVQIPGEIPYVDLRCLAVGIDGTMWIGTDASGLLHYVPNAPQEWETYNTNNSGLAGNQIRDIAINSDGNLWIATDAGVNYYEPTSQQWQTVVPSNLVYPVQSIVLEQNGSVWMGSLDRIIHYTPGDIPIWEYFTTQNSPLPDYSISAIVGDVNNSLWFGTYGGGVVHYAPTLSSTWQIFTTGNSGLIDNRVTALALGTDNTLWVGTENGASHFTRQVWESFSDTHGLTEGAIQSILVDEEGSVWFGHGDLIRYAADSVPKWQTFPYAGHLGLNLNARDMVIGSEKTLWLAEAEALISFTRPQQYSDLLLQMLGPSLTLPDHLLTYTLTLVNQGQRPAHQIMLTLTLPPGMTLVDTSIPPVQSSPPIWSLGSLLASDWPLTVVVTTLLQGAQVTPGMTLVTQAAVGTIDEEVYQANNQAQLETYVQDPYRADVRLTMIGPPLLVAGNEAVFQVQLDNVGGLAATEATLTVTLPPSLTYVYALPVPTTVEPLTWQWTDIPSGEAPFSVYLTVTAAADLSPAAGLAVSSLVTTTTPEANPLNNQATITVPASLTDTLTLFLVAPQRMGERYGAAPVMPALYTLAAHPHVRGVILDILTDADVRAAYAAWDANPGSWVKANEVAAAIKNLIDQTMQAYPNLRYLVLVGSDEIIPFYRVADQNGTMWQENSYAGYVPGGTVRDALASNRFLSDDYYADRIPSVPDSPFWTDGHPLFVPDYAIGRLVETPDEIVTAIDAFLSMDGVNSLDEAVVGSIPELTDDLGQMQCQTLADAGVPATCVQNPGELRQTMLNWAEGIAFASVHSNHLSEGDLDTGDILARAASFLGTLHLSIGCHIGLNVPESVGPLPDEDMTQALLRRGGVAAGPTAYSYASGAGQSYAESLFAELTAQMLAAPTQTLGAAIMQAKQQYFAAHENWFDYLDEKVMLPFTLYGLPMLQLALPPTATLSSPPTTPPPAPPRVIMPENMIEIAYTLAGLTFTEQIGEGGTYYSHNGHVLAQNGQPAQPFLRIPLSRTIGTATPRAAILYSAAYSRVTPFDPFVVQSWALGHKQLATLAESPAEIEGWDRDYPYALGHFRGLSDTAASLNLVLGAFNGDMDEERLFHDLTVAVIYSDHPDQQRPTIRGQFSWLMEDFIRLGVQAVDASGISRMIAVCDDGAGAWQTTSLVRVGTAFWTGTCPAGTIRSYVQVVDSAGNLARTDWVAPHPPPW